VQKLAKEPQVLVVTDFVVIRKIPFDEASRHNRNLHG